MKYLLAFIPLLALLLSTEVSAKKCTGKKPGGIIGGTKATRGQLPWQILLRNSETGGLCGGSIVSPRHIITAGHCIKNKTDNGKSSPASIDIYAGILHLYDAHKPPNNPDVQTIPVKAIYTDTIWDIAHNGYELTILTMKSNFTMNEAVNFIRPANKQDPTDLNGQEVIASGWGTIDHYGNDGTISPDLLWTKMMVSKCDVNWRDGDDLFCARGANGENVCSGDSGGPIVCKDTAGKDYLCGFSSMSECDKGQSQLGRVNFFADFIKKTMSKP